MLSAIKYKLVHPLLPIPASRIDTLAHERLRLRIFFAVAFLKLFNFIGGAWDIQWHVAIGRDSLFIPPHLLVMFAFVSGLATVLALIAYETSLASAGQPQTHTARLGLLSAPPAAFGVLFGYTAALLSGGFDELWHELFGLDVTLWSPPHMLIMLATTLVDFSLIIGIAATARRLCYDFTWNSPLLWGLTLTGAYAFESVNFQMGEAFIIGYRHGGTGLYGLLYPVLVGALLPLSLLLLIQLARRFWVALLIIAVALVLQYLATGVASAGFAILKPVSVIDEYVRQNPDSTTAKAREFAKTLGFHGLIGIEQAWTMTLSAVSLALVACLDLIPWARRRPLLAAPLYGASLPFFSYLLFQQIPALRSYPIGLPSLVLAVFISGLASLLTGSLGLRIARRFDPGPPPS